MNANGLYNGLDAGAAMGVYNGTDGGARAGLVGNDVNPKLYIIDAAKNEVIVAYSIRKLSNSYTGPCIRVRRSSDNTELDIGFDKYGELDESSLLGFLNNSDGFISVWYDQSGRSRNISQSTTTQQPRIASSGVIVKEKGKPIINFDGVDDLLFNNSIASQFIGTNISKSFICVHKFNVLTNGAIILSIGAPANSPIIYFGLNAVGNTTAYAYGNRQSAGGSATPSVISTINANITSLRMFNAYQFDSFANLIVDNVYAANGDISTGVMTPTQFGVGGQYRSALTNLANVNIHELIIYSNNQFENRSLIENNINQYYKIY